MTSTHGFLLEIECATTMIVVREAYARMEAMTSFLRSIDIASTVVAVGAVLLGGFGNAFAQWLVRKSQAIRGGITGERSPIERSLAVELREARRRSTGY
jgi:hypothetical protein